MDFKQLLKKYGEISRNEHEKGVHFERLMKSYLLTDPKYAQLHRVWMWNEFPARSQLGDIDSGIDLVAETHTGDLWAIQCKSRCSSL